MNCGRVQNRLSAYLDQELGGAEMLAIQRHMSQCEECRAEREALEQLRRLLGGLSAVEPRPGSQERAFRQLEDVAAGRPRQRTASGASRGWPAGVLGRILSERSGTAEWKARPARGTVRGAAWAGVACLGLVAGLAATTLSQPQHPDAVVAMIRPEMELAPATVGLLLPVTDYPSWPRPAARLDWPGNLLTMPVRGDAPGYQLVGLENE